jgi:WhiB family transcriptional regulator, redox-sensing transcriptional regulator
MEFFDRGACNRDPYPDAWHPRAGQPAGYALNVCARCPVQAECRDYAIERPHLEGIWGGTRDSERRALRVREGNSRLFPPETRARALEMFAAHRAEYRSDAACFRAIAADLGIAYPETVRRWHRGAGHRATVAEAA